MKQNRKQRRASVAARKGQRPRAQRASDGRVHLVVHRDPVSGSERLTLSSPLFKEDWQNDLASAAANTAVGLLSGGPNLERTVELAQSAMAAMSRLAEGLLARAPEGAVACRAGCDHCCYQAVGITVPEALAIFDHLRSTLSSAELASVAGHISTLHERTRALSSTQRFSPEHPCPFLKAGQCSIYDVRPLACRGMNSLDAGECASRLREPEARALFLENGLGSRSFMEPIRAFHAVSAGLQLSLSELYGLDMRPIELTAAMHLLLSGAESLSDQWLRGQSPFESAGGGDNQNDPRMRELSGTLPSALAPLAWPPSKND